MRSDTNPTAGARRIRLRMTVGLTILAVMSCSSEAPTDPDPNPTTITDPGAYLSDSIPPWSVYSPPRADQPAAPDSASRPPTQVTLDVEVVDVDGAIDTLTNQTYICTETPHSVTDTPERLVMYSPDATILWAGGFIQGRSHRDLGSLQGLVVDERAPINVSIPLLGIAGQTFREVDTPTQAEVAQAVNDIIRDATTEDLTQSSDIVFKMKTFHSEEEFGLGVGASGRYLGFSASSGFSNQRAESETTVTAEFYEKMFTVIVAPPSTPAGFFNADLTPEVFQSKYVGPGAMGPSNVPLYISTVVYGRSLMYSMTSTASESEMRATLDATYRSIGGSASVKLSARQETLLRESEISVVAIGGNAANVLSLIRENNLGAYFEEGAPLTSAAPLSYTFSTLRGETADVAETTSYVVRECEPSGTGSLTFKDPQTTSAPIAGSFTSYAGDFDGDGAGDLLWNRRSGGTNDFFVGYGQPDGNFEFGGAVQHPAAPTHGWGTYELRVSDLDGDGSDDLVWSAATLDTLSIYTAMSSGAGFDFPDETALPGNWSEHDLVIGDFDADGDADLAYNRTATNGNSFVLGEGDGSGTFAMGPNDVVTTATGWESYRPAVAANVDNDAADEVIIPRLASDNTVWIVELDPVTKTFELVEYSQRLSSWHSYTTLVGDIDGRNGADIYNYSPGAGGVHIWTADGDGTFSPATYQWVTPDQSALPGFVGHVGDVNEDGKADLILNRLTQTENEVIIAYGTADVMHPGSDNLSIPGGVLEHPVPAANGWDLYETRILDVDGDGKDDVVWAIPQGDLTIHVGLAR